jgi:hypothetical protein
VPRTTNVYRVSIVASTPETGANEAQLRALELRLERETAVLIDRLDARAEELECVELELQQERVERERAERRAAELAAQLDELTVHLASRPRITGAVRWAKRLRDASRKRHRPGHG